MHILATFATLARQTQREVVQSCTTFVRGTEIWSFLVNFRQFSNLVIFGQFWSILDMSNLDTFWTHKYTHIYTHKCLNFFLTKIFLKKKIYLIKKKIYLNTIYKLK